MLINKLFNRTTGFKKVAATSWIAPLSSSGEVISTENALDISIIFSCINIRANKIASMPLQHFQKTEAGRTRIHNSQIAYLIEHRPNKYMTPFEFKKTMSIHRDLYGVCYIHQEIDRKGNPIALHILNAARVTVIEDADGTLFYVDNSDAANPQVYTEEQIIKTFYFTTDGIQPKSPITVAREQAGIILSQNKWMGGFYENGLSGGGFLKIPSKLEKTAKDKVRQEFMKANSGQANTGKVMILDNGMEYEATDVVVKDLQFVESQNMQTKDIARIFGVPMSLLGETGGVTYSNVEQMSLDFVLNTIMPMLVAIEDELNYKLFTKKEVLDGNYVKFNMASALRSNQLDQANYLKIMLETGLMTLNEGRRTLELNDVEHGDNNLASLNYVWLKNMEEYQRNKSLQGVDALQGGE